jgi:hypothetical protein
MVQRSIEADSLPPVHTAQQLQRTLSRVNKSAKKGYGQNSRLGTGAGTNTGTGTGTRTGTGGSSRGFSPMVDSLRQSASASKLPPATPSSQHPSYEDFIMESLMEHCRALQSRVQV